MKTLDFHIVPPLTSQTKQLVRSGIGFRTEAAYGEGYRSAKSVILHENDELGNTSTISSVASHLGLPGNASVEEVFATIDKRFGSNAKAIWFASLTAVRHFYLDNPSDLDKIDVYTIPKKAIVIEDLGYDGALFLMPLEDYEKMDVYNYIEWRKKKKERF